MATEQAYSELFAGLEFEASAYWKHMKLLKHWYNFVLIQTCFGTLWQIRKLSRLPFGILLPFSLNNFDHIALYWILAIYNLTEELLVESMK